MSDVIATPADADPHGLPPLLVVEPLERVMDDYGLGHGPVRATRIGEGISNVTFLIARDDLELVLRRPPRPPFHPRAHDVIREARLLTTIGPAAARTPQVALSCTDDSVIGAPFYLMDRVAGHVLTATLPAELDTPGAGTRIAEELVDGLVELHALDWSAYGLDAFGHPGDNLTRALNTFDRLWDSVRSRAIPAAEQVREWLRANLPEQQSTTLVHGDYRLGNVVFAAGSSPRLAAVLDWEVATLGDPMFDVAYLLSTWPDGDDRDGVLLDFASVVRPPAFPGRAALLARYAEHSPHLVHDLDWYLAFASWRTAVGLESFYQRHLHSGQDPAEIARLERGVPALFDRALAATHGTFRLAVEAGTRSTR